MEERFIDAKKTFTEMKLNPNVDEKAPKFISLAIFGGDSLKKPIEWHKIVIYFGQKMLAKRNIMFSHFIH